MADRVSMSARIGGAVPTKVARLFPDATGDVLAEAARGRPERGALAMLEQALRSSEPERCRDVVAALVAAGLGLDQVADLYVPELARMLGLRWCEDSLSFAEVTIGMSRLQRLLRELGPEFQADGRTARDAPALLLVVPDSEQHTLGAVLLSGQLRRRGLSVRLWIGYRPGDARTALGSGNYDAVMISAAWGQSLESLREVVKSLRTVAPSALPVCVGGSFVESPDATVDLGPAVHVTNDIDEALELCGLTTRHAPIASGAPGD